ncbi:MAG: hypothetical protein HYX79_04745 [Chloroflexi bacterium]|nr:hypothetical protein [Chloroflexota bacterium]
MAIALLVVFMLILLILSLRLSLFLARRAICTVIKMFREKGAVQFETAKLLKDVGFARFPMFHILRDYRPWAFQTLLQAEIIQPGLFDGSFYLSEETLSARPGIQCLCELPKEGSLLQSGPTKPRASWFDKLQSYGRSG